MAGNKAEKSSSESVTHVPLSELLLDNENPRLGAATELGIKSQVVLLDKIVEEFGVDDVLSSIAVNGYFNAEPVIGVRNVTGDKITIKEGNRRLAACLILSGDQRAKNQGKRTVQYQAILQAHGRSELTEIPVIIYGHNEDSKRLLSYLGVRHIAASQPWDSYAKAAWIASVLEEKTLTLDDVSTMIGDQHRTVARLLEGFYFVKQLNATARFNPKDSLKRGRGSNPEYPFSWVYTVLGYKPVRNWLQLKDLGEGATPDPIPTTKLDDASDLLIFMFGNKSKSRVPVISDSREISELAIAVSEPERREHLRNGKTIRDVTELSRPASDRVAAGLVSAQDSLLSALAPISQGEVNEVQAKSVIDTSKKVRALAIDVYEKLQVISQEAKGAVDA